MALSKIRNDSLADTAVHGRRNLVQNGTYSVNQRGTISSSATTLSSGTYLIDRWYLRKQNTGSHDVTLLEDQTVTGLTGLNNVLKITEFHDSSWLGNFIEIAAHPFMSEQKVTVSFYAKADAAINAFKVFLHDNSDGGDHGDPYFTETATISTSWQRYSYSMTIGTLANDNASGYLNLGFGQTDTDTTFYITGIQLELGDTATPFEHRSFGEELALCQRYFYATDLSTGWFIDAYLTASSYCIQAVPFATTMRAFPTTTADMSTNWITSNVTTNAISTYNKNHSSWQIRASSTGRAYAYYNANDGATIKFDAEL